MEVIKYIDVTRAMFPDQPPYQWTENDSAPLRSITKNLAESKIVLISSSGVYLKDQQPFNPIKNDLTFREIPKEVNVEDLKISHHFYDHTDADKDINCVFPIERMRELEQEGFIGIHNHGTIKIGDTFTQKEPLKFTGIPHFAPEHFCRVRLKDPLRMKHLQKGLIQLSEEGAIQVFKPLWGSDNILGAVGALQFDVTMSRLQDEYSVYADYEKTDYAVARWVTCDDIKIMEDFQKKNQTNLALDTEGNLVYLALSEWRLSHTMEEWPKVKFLKTMEKN